MAVAKACRWVHVQSKQMMGGLTKEAATAHSIGLRVGHCVAAVADCICAGVGHGIAAVADCICAGVGDGIAAIAEGIGL